MPTYHVEKFIGSTSETIADCKNFIAAVCEAIAVRAETESPSISIAATKRSDIVYINQHGNRIHLRPLLIRLDIQVDDTPESLTNFISQNYAL